MIVALTGGAVIGGVLGAAAVVPLVAAAWAVVWAVRPDVSDPPALREDDRSRSELASSRLVLG